MKSCLQISSMIWLVGVIRLGAQQNPLPNECVCGQTRVVAELGQIVTCQEKRDGTYVAQAHTAPKGSQSGEELQRWLLGKLLHRKISGADLKKTEYQRMLREGMVRLSDGSQVRFKLPRE